MPRIGMIYQLCMHSKCLFLVRKVCHANYCGMVSSVQVEMYHTQLEILPLLLLIFKMLNFPQETKTFYVISPHWHMAQVVEILSQVRQVPILYSWYHVCWCPGDTSSQGMSNHDMYYLKPNKCGPRTLRVNGTTLVHTRSNPGRVNFKRPAWVIQPIPCLLMLWWL